MHIAVAGNIGSGKTSLVEKLSIHYGWKPYYESIDNPYLDDFYRDMNRWSFNLQMCFLSNKVSQIKYILKEKDVIIQDRTVYEEAFVFVKNLRNMTLMSGRDYNTYLKIFKQMVDDDCMPHLLIYLKGSVDKLVSQIHKRGRTFEQNIQSEYLIKLNDLYNDWVENKYSGKVIVIDIDKIDFVENEKDFEYIVSEIDKAIEENGLFERS